MMKERIRHYILVLILLFAAVGGISVFLHNVSFNPSFSMIDALSGATKKSHHKTKENNDSSKWNYERDDIAFSDSAYSEEAVTVGEKTYRILKKDSTVEHPVILSNKENRDYQRAVEDIAQYLDAQGYSVRIKECSEVMMLSLAHAGQFDLFLMSEEEQE